MKKIILLVVLCFITYNTFAQQNPKTLKVKLYNQSSFVKNKSNYSAANNYYLKSEKETNILSPTFAIAYTANNGNTHEIELNKFAFYFNSETDELLDTINSNIVGGQEISNFNLSFRYEYTPSSKKSKLNKKGTFSVGYGLQPYIYHTKTAPLITTNFPVSKTQIGGSGYIAPRFTYQVSEKLYFDINIPFNLIDVNFTNTKIDDPTKNKSERTVHNTEFNMLPMNYNLRIGLAYRI